MNKKFVKKIGAAFLLIASKLFYRMIFFKKHQTIVIFDIDNTVADSWITFQQGYKSEKERLQAIEPFLSMVNLTNNYYSQGLKVIFLSARPYSFYKLTYNWLKKHQFNFNFLFLVPKAKDKIFFLNSIQKKNVIYYDDLSYHHERGKIKYYSSVIDTVKGMKNITYHDYEEILRLQKNEK